MLQKWTSPLCSFCRLSDQTVLHLFYECDKIQNLWNDLALFENDFVLYITPQPSFLSFVNADLKLISILYNSRRSEQLMLRSFTREIKTQKKKIQQTMKQKQYEQGKMAASRKCFKDQSQLVLYLIQPFSGVGWSWFLVTRGLRKVGGRRVFCNLQFMKQVFQFSVVNNFKKKKKCYKKKKRKKIAFLKMFTGAYV